MAAPRENSKTSHIIIPAGTRNVTSTVPFTPEHIWESTTLKPVAPEDFKAATIRVLHDIRRVTNSLIKSNHKTMPAGLGGKFGVEWARRAILLTDEMPPEYRQRARTNNIAQYQAARAILGWQARERVATVLDTLGWDASYKDCSALYATLAKQAGEPPKKQRLKWRLYANIKRSGKHPSVPSIARIELPVDKGGSSLGQVIVFDDGIWCRNYAIGDTYYDFWIPCGGNFRRYANIVKVTRPKVVLVPSGDGNAENDDVRWTFAVIEEVSVPEASFGSVAFVDRNMDGTKGFCMVRLSRNGHAGREMSQSVDADRKAYALAELVTELGRKRAKVARAMPWADTAQAELKIRELEEKIARCKRDLSKTYAADAEKHARAGEVTFLEDLRGFGGGPVHFRHGQQDRDYIHRFERAGKPLALLDPAYTSQTCPVCEARLSRADGSAADFGERLMRCPACGAVLDRDYAACLTGARWAFDSVGHPVTAGALVLPPACEVPALGNRKGGNAGASSEVDAGDGFDDGAGSGEGDIVPSVVSVARVGDGSQGVRSKGAGRNAGGGRHRRRGGRRRRAHNACRGVRVGAGRTRSSSFRARHDARDRFPGRVDGAAVGCRAVMAGSGVVRRVRDGRGGDDSPDFILAETDRKGFDFSAVKCHRAITRLIGNGYEACRAHFMTDKKRQE